jgi:hypothetical protein
MTDKPITTKLAANDNWPLGHYKRVRGILKDV